MAQRSAPCHFFQLQLPPPSPSPPPPRLLLRLLSLLLLLLLFLFTLSQIAEKASLTPYCLSSAIKRRKCVSGIWIFSAWIWHEDIIDAAKKERFTVQKLIEAQRTQEAADQVNQAVNERLKMNKILRLTKALDCYLGIIERSTKQLGSFYWVYIPNTRETKPLFTWMS